MVYNPRMNGKAKVYMKDGEIIEGEITFDGKDEIYLRIDEQTYVVFKHELLKVILDNNKASIKPVR